MARQVRIAGSLVTSSIEFFGEEDTLGLVSVLDRGTYGTGRALVDDPAKTLTLKGWQSFTVDETDCTPSRIFTGVIRERTQARGGRHFTGNARVHDCVIMDLNERLHRKLPYVNAGKRPYETDTARITWLLASRALSGIVYNEGLFAAAPAFNFLAEDIRESYPDDIIRELAATAGKQFGVVFDDASGHASLYYQPDDVTGVYVSPISISNDPADESATCVAPDDDAEEEFRPDDVYSGVLYKSRVPTPSFVTSADIAAEYGIEREAVYYTDRVGRAATQLEQAQAFLNGRRPERRILTVTITLPSTKVNHVRAGHEIQVKFTHLDGLSSFTTGYVRRVVVGGGVTVDKYELRLEIEIPGEPADDATAAGDCEDPDNVALTATIVGKAERLRAGIRQEMAPGNWEPVNPSRVNDGLSGGGDPSSAGPSFVSSDEQDWQFWQADLGSPHLLSSFGVKSNDGAAAGMNYWAWSNDGDTWEHFVEFAVTQAGSVSDSTYTPTAEITARYVRMGKTASGSGLWNFIGISIVEWLINGCDVTEVPLPATGVAVGPETSADTWDGVNTEGTTTHPFIEGTLVVIHDGTDQSAHVLSQNGEAQTYELDYAPRFGAVIRTRYEAA